MKKLFVIIYSVLLCYGLQVGISFAEAEKPVETEKTQVVIIGTIHAAHHKNAKYSPDVLKEIILTLKPDAVLTELPLNFVESSGRPLERLRSKDNSCPEVWAADEAAMELGIRQIPFDRPDRQENFKKTNYFERQKRADKLVKKWAEQVNKDDPNCVDLKIAKLWGYAGQAEGHLLINSAPEVINSEAHDSIIRIKHSLWFDIMPIVLKKYPGYGNLIDDYHFVNNQWQERNRIMADNIIKTATKYTGKRLVVATGATHRYVLRDLLRQQEGIDLKEYWEIIEPDKAGLQKYRQVNEKAKSQIKIRED